MTDKNKKKKKGMTVYEYVHQDPKLKWLRIDFLKQFGTILTAEKQSRKAKYKG